MTKTLIKTIHRLYYYDEQGEPHRVISSTNSDTIFERIRKDFADDLKFISEPTEGEDWIIWEITLKTGESFHIGVERDEID